MEMADGIVINKADGNNLEKAILAKNQYKNALALFPQHESQWKPQVLTCSAFIKENIAEVANIASEYITLQRI